MNRGTRKHFERTRERKSKNVDKLKGRVPPDLFVSSDMVEYLVRICHARL